MLAAHDQENLAYSHHTAATAKPLNQGARQAVPKTPGNKSSKAPFKLPLNDENHNGGFGAGKAGPRGLGKGNENIFTSKKQGASEKSAFATPMGQRTRAPLGMKTTNAKAKAFQTPAPVQDKDGGKTAQKTISARKAKPRVSHANVMKLEVLGDNDMLEERDIEYMPPKPIDLPDDPDDFPPLDFSMYEGKGMLKSMMADFAYKVDDDGKTRTQRQEEEQEKAADRSMRKAEAASLRDIHSRPVLCFHSPECSDGICKATLENRKAAEKEYKAAVAKIEAEAIPAWKKALEKERVPKAIAPKLSRPNISLASARSATSSGPSLKHQLNTSLAHRQKKPAVPPANPSSMRHNAAVAASKTTMGYSKGRAASRAIGRALSSDTSRPKAAIERRPDATLAPVEYISRYGVPPLGTDTWLRYQQAGCSTEDDGKDYEELMGLHTETDPIREQAEEDFVLSFGD